MIAVITSFITSMKFVAMVFLIQPRFYESLNYADIIFQANYNPPQNYLGAGG